MIPLRNREGVKVKRARRPAINFCLWFSEEKQKDVRFVPESVFYNQGIMGMVHPFNNQTHAQVFLFIFFAFFYKKYCPFGADRYTIVFGYHFV
jgi:hypothetical protein